MLAVSNLRYLLAQLRAKLWIKPALTSLGAALWVQIALLFGGYLDSILPFDISRDVLLRLLQILASTMLMVAIFAVSAMVAAFAAVTSTASPRATRVVMQDRSSQNALSAFLSAFIFAIVGLVALSAFGYGSGGRLAMFIGYVSIVLWVLVSFIRWVDEISKLGRMGDTIRRVEASCHEALDAPGVADCLGAATAEGEPPWGEMVFSPEVGYLQHVDVAAIQKIATSLDTNIRLQVRPGTFIYRHSPLLIVPNAQSLDEQTRVKLTRAFTIGEERHIENDPRFGMLMLAEIADRALSPAVNDPGTAIAVLGAQVRLFTHWAEAVSESRDCEFPNVEIPRLPVQDLLDDAITPIARDGAGFFEVGMRLQKSLGALARLGNPAMARAARFHSRLALEQALERLPTRHHRETLRETADAMFPADAQIQPSA
jgi:uncharacterized membrane protein